MTIGKTEFFQALKDRDILVRQVFNLEKYRRGFKPETLQEAVYSYLNRPAKRFRPGILFFCCGAVGGNEEQALLAAASVEVYHTWTLVHDDVIDNDPKRRGLDTIHEEFKNKALTWGYSPREAADLGRDIAILSGDLQHAWSVRLLLDLVEQGVSMPVVFDLIHRLEVDVTNRLVEGEALDVLFSKRSVAELAEADVLNMLELKTGILYEYAGIAGASIGLGRTASENTLIQNLGRFARLCGIAFQLQDDILGITGDEKVLGKPVSSDIREGKRTIIVLHAYKNANHTEREYLTHWLGNPAAGEKETEEVRRILTEYDSINYTKKMAETIIADAVNEISAVPESIFKNYLLTWAKYIVDREF